MPLYGTAQTGGVTTALSPGDAFLLFDGTETPAAGLTSVAFNRAASADGGPRPMVFTVDFPLAAPTAVVQIEASNDDVASHYQSIYTSVVGTQLSSYSDYGEFAFYRALLYAYTDGGMPVVTVQR